NCPYSSLHLPITHCTFPPLLPFYLFSSSILRPQQRPPLFPYTTLFRSAGCPRRCRRISGSWYSGPRPKGPRAARRPDNGVAARRSEEHTSELQSRGHLVCRLLLEKKNRLACSPPSLAF